MSVKRRYIPDANIFLSVLLAESEVMEISQTFLQDALLGKISLIVPTLWGYEICNRLGRVRPLDVAKTLEEYLGYKMLCTHYDLTEAVINQAFEIIKVYPVSFYDASYHALALITKGTFVTLDQKYYQKTKKLKHVILLEEY